MNNLLTHYLVNWIDGMKLSSSHFIAVQDFVTDSVRDAIALQTTDLNYGFNLWLGFGKDARADGSLFHRLKFGLRKAFFICFEMTTTTKGLSASQVARRYEISRQTAHYFMQKVREAMKSSESHKMNDSV